MSKKDKLNPRDAHDHRKRKDSFSSGGLYPQDEMKILRHWGYIKRAVVIGHVIDPLIEKGVFSPDQWMTLKGKHTTEPERTEDFLYHILKAKPESYSVLLTALGTRGYGHVVSELEGTGSKESSPPVSGNVIQPRPVGRPVTYSKYNLNNSLKSQQSVPDPRNGASASSASEAGAEGGEAGVRPEDLFEMKEEIKSELRRLRENIESDRTQDRLDLQLLERKHTQLEKDFNSMRKDKDSLSKELTVCVSNVSDLKSKMAQKEVEYEELKKKNKELRQQIEVKVGDLEKVIQLKESEKRKLESRLSEKELEYKQLQRTLETVKSDHEDRLVRVKNLNKDKIQLAKEIQSCMSEKRSLEVKIKQMEHNIQKMKETHSRESEDIKQQLERQKTLLEEKERERVNLAKKLELGVRENENLRERNKNLEECLQKSKDEKEHLKTRMKQMDMQNFSIPPFMVGSTGNRHGGFRPSCSKWK